MRTSPAASTPLIKSPDSLGPAPLVTSGSLEDVVDGVGGLPVVDPVDEGLGVGVFEVCGGCVFVPVSEGG